MQHCKLHCRYMKSLNETETPIFFFFLHVNILVYNCIYNCLYNADVSFWEFKVAWVGRFCRTRCLMINQYKLSITITCCKTTDNVVDIHVHDDTCT